MSTTPRTDAARAKTLTPEYEYEGAEHEAWEFARQLETELNELRRSMAFDKLRGGYAISELF